MPAKRFLAALLLFAAALAPAEPPTVETKPAKLPPLIDPQEAIAQFQLPKGMKMDLFASEPQLLNPVQFCFDDQGRIYIAETYRYRKSVYDIRSHMDMYQDDLACRTVEDRIAMIRKFLGAKEHTMTNESERVRLLEDRNGDGKADHSTIFAEGFNSTVDGLGSGVLAFRGNVYYTDIPNLWLLRDPNHTGHATERTALSTGYGVHFSLTGHDLHGLCVGPDGRIYFSEGDRGMHVTNSAGKVLDFPDTGGVYRCNLDGSGLELFATGLRNPQKLAFDDYGNLFTGDNNCDNGDAARLVYVVEGGDSGWRIGHQISETTPAGLWNSEKLWHLQFPGQSAYIIPPVAHIATGPSGIAHYPGTGFPGRLKDHFFLCDYKGASPNSGIHSFALKPRGAGFEMVDHTQFLWHILATDVAFSPDGRMFVSDWVAHWPQTDKGRLYRLYDPALVESPLVLETKKLLAEGMTNRPSDELIKLLGHADQRVRLNAQFELVDRLNLKTAGNSPGKYDGIIESVLRVATDGKSQLARIHALWTLAQAGRGSDRFEVEVIKSIESLLGDSDPEIRSQAAKVLGEIGKLSSVPGLIRALQDASPRTRFFAAQSLGKLGPMEPLAIKPLLEMLRENADQDPLLRHAGVMGIVGMFSGPFRASDTIVVTGNSAVEKTLVDAAKDKSSAVRMGVLLAMRRLRWPEISIFLHDADPQIVLEAARAINDVPIPGAMPELAKLIEHPTGEEFLDWRALNAAFRVGGRTNAEALAACAGNGSALEKVRVEALHALEYWDSPPPRDRLTGLWRPLPTRDAKDVNDTVRPALETIFKQAPAKVQLAAIRVVDKFAGPDLFPLVTNRHGASAVRIAALNELDKLKDARLPSAMKLALADSDPELRGAGNALQARSNPAAAVAEISQTLESGGLAEKQTAFATLGRIETPVADRLLAKWLDRLNAGTVPKELQFDLVAAATDRTNTPVKNKLKDYNKETPKKDEFAGYRETMFGGDAESGRRIFTEKPEASCFTCHKVHGVGGDVGPELAGIITKHDRAYLLESILFPNKVIAPGFESVLLKLNDGTVRAGILKSEDATELTLNISEDGVYQLVKVKKSEVKSRQKGLSAMPEGLATVLTKREIRDLVEFLAEAK